MHSIAQTERMVKMAALMEMHGDQYLNGDEKFDKAILPVGSCENHGGHLPYGTDTFVCDKLARLVAKEVPGTLVLPPVTVGLSYHYDYFPLTLTLQPETLLAVLKDILTSVIRGGIKHIFVMNGHDGNIEPIELATRSIKVRHPDVKIASLDAWWIAAGNLLPPDTFEVWNGLGHAGEGETSIALSLFPELVNMEVAAGVVPSLPKNINIKWLFAELTGVGATGDPTKATREKGDKMRDALVREVAGFLNRMDAEGWDYASPEAPLRG